MHMESPRDKEAKEIWGEMAMPQRFYQRESIMQDTLQAETMSNRTTVTNRDHDCDNCGWLMRNGHTQRWG